MDIEQIAKELVNLCTEAKRILTSAQKQETENIRVSKELGNVREDMKIQISELQDREKAVAKIEVLVKNANELEALRNKVAEEEAALVDQKNALVSYKQSIEAESQQKMDDLRLEKQALTEGWKQLDEEKRTYKTKLFDEMKKKMR
jgi:hypothetical protein